MFEAAIEEHPFFKTMDPHLLEEIAGMASQATFAKGVYLFRADDHAEKFYAIDSGRVDLETAVAGRGPVTIHSIGPKEVLGWSWLFPPYRWRFDAKVVEPMRAIVFDAGRLRRRCDENHELGYQLMKRVAQVLIQALIAERGKIQDLSGRSPG